MSQTKEALANDLIAKIKETLPDLKLKFEVIEDYLTIKPEAFLGAEVFAKFRAVIIAKPFNGEYVSAEKHSHFRISLTSNSKDESNLKTWYEKQKLKPLPLTVTLNLNLQVTPEQLEDLLKKAACSQQRRQE
jgi:hypothetical protein